MAGYLGSTPVPQATQHRESFTATEGQTSFATAGYTPQFLDVFLNGSHLSPADFVATNSSDVVLVVAASADDVCDIVSYTPFEVAGATFTGTTTVDVATVGGTLTAAGKITANGELQVNGTGTVAGFEATDGACFISIKDDDGTTAFLGCDTGALVVQTPGASFATKLSVSSAGAVTKPLQPAFHVTKNAAQNNIPVSTETLVTFQTETYDVGSNFASSIFTAPVTGKYVFTANVRIDNIDTASVHDDFQILTSNRGYKSIFDFGVLASDPVFWTYQMSVVADMDADDTAKCTFFQTGGTAQADIINDAGRTFFSGILIG